MTDNGTVSVPFVTRTLFPAASGSKQSPCTSKVKAEQASLSNGVTPLITGLSKTRMIWAPSRWSGAVARISTSAQEALAGRVTVVEISPSAMTTGSSGNSSAPEGLPVSLTAVPPSEPGQEVRKVTSAVSPARTRLSPVT